MRFPRFFIRLPRSVVALGILATVTLLIFVACVTPGPPLRRAGVVAQADVENLAIEEAYRRVQNGSLEKNDEYTLAFLEFDSSGKPGKGQAALAAEAIRQNPGRDAVVVLFVHGWGHSADARDDHVVGFRKTLSALAGKLPGRSVVGIYVGWRAKWLKEPLHFLTYLDRSIVAQNLGGENCRVRKELGKLRRAVEERGREGDVSVAVGHSLGGQFLFSYTEECLDTDDDESCCDCGRAECSDKSPPQALPLFGDLVLLVNPAQDSHDYEVFLEYAGRNSKARPVVVVLSSEADSVVGSIYRWGRTIRNVFWWKYWNESFLPETIGLGWNADQVTHALCSSAGGASSKSVCSTKTQETYNLCCSYGSTVLSSRKDCEQPGPFMLVRVDGRVVTGHGDMFNEPFANFLRQFVAGVTKAQGAAIPCPAP